MQNHQIVFIMTDTQRHDMLNCYRQTGLKTPYLDALASEGCRFDQAYTTSPVCQPARAALFFGQYAHEVGCWSNSSAPSQSARSIGQRLQKHGVRTAYIGKWHLDGSDYFGLGHCPEGWDPDYWFDMRNYLEQMSDEDRLRSRREETNQDNIAPEFTYAHQCSDRAVHFLRQTGEEPFFLTVSYDEPHGPFLCPEPYASMYKDFEFPVSENVFDSLADKPEHQKVWAAGNLKSENPDVKIKAPDFFGCNSFVDYEIGRVVQAVKEHAPDALIIFTSDHGDFLDSHALSGKGPAGYEEITHIPLLISGPGIKPGSADGAPVSHIDLPPTIFDLMGLPIPAVFPGKSLLPQITGESAQVNPYVFIEYGRYEVDHDGFGGFQPLRSAFDGRYKLVINLLSSDELYDLTEDRAEMKNLITEPAMQTIRDQLHDAILENMNTTRDPFRGYAWARRPWRQDARPASWDDCGMTRQREEDEVFEKRQLDYATGLAMEKAVRPK